MMMMSTITGIWAQRNLYTYVPEVAPDIVFYYIPLTGHKIQEEKRELYKKFTTTYDYMAEVFSGQMFMFGINGPQGRHKHRFIWPEEKAHQESLLQNIPRPVVIEAGAQILGWVRREGESPKQFIDRIALDLSKTR